MTDNEKEVMRLLSNRATVRRGFEMLVGLYSEKIYWQVRRIVITHDDANDVVQNAFLKAWLNLDEFENRSKISTWLSRISINESLDFLRRKQRQSGINTDDGQLIENKIADEYFDGDAIESLLKDAIAQLPDVQRTVFTLRYYEDMKYSDISSILGTSVGALKASYHLAVKKIENYFSKHD